MFERIAPEQHDTLDGVPEPAENPHLYGHEQAVSMLTAAYRAGKLPHALIFAGPVGIGKATLAFHLASYLLRHPDHRNAPEAFAARFAVSRETLDRLKTYEALLKRWQKTINLVAPSTLDLIWHRHFADSAQVYFASLPSPLEGEGSDGGGAGGAPCSPPTGPSGHLPLKGGGVAEPLPAVLSAGPSDLRRPSWRTMVPDHAPSQSVFC